SGNNSYTGGTTIAAGELSIASDANIGGASAGITFSGGILQVTGTALTTLGTHVINNTTFNGGFDIAAAGNNFTVAQALSGSGGLNKLGAGTLTLTAANSYTGPTTVTAGTLTIASTGGLGDNSVTANSGATLNVNGSLATNTA